MNALSTLTFCSLLALFKNLAVFQSMVTVEMIARCITMLSYNMNAYTMNKSVKPMTVSKMGSGRGITVMFQLQYQAPLKRRNELSSKKQVKISKPGF